MCDGKSGRSPKRVSGRLRFRHHFAFSPLIGFGRVACACRGGAKRRRSRIKTSTRHGCKRRNFADNNSLEVSDISVFLFETSFLLVEISAK